MHSNWRQFGFPHNLHVLVFDVDAKTVATAWRGLPSGSIANPALEGQTCIEQLNMAESGAAKDRFILLR